MKRLRSLQLLEGKHLKFHSISLPYLCYVTVREWWDATSKSGTGPLHAMNPVRVQFIRDHAAKYFDREQSHPLDRIRGLKVLDVGCGGGLLSESLARLGAEVTAIDPGEENIGVAKGHSSLDPLTSTIDYQRTTVGKYDRYSSCDSIVSL